MFIFAIKSGVFKHDPWAFLPRNSLDQCHSDYWSARRNGCAGAIFQLTATGLRKIEMEINA